MEREHFDVEAPVCSGLAIGDVVYTTSDVCLSKGFLLGRGVVVKIDEDKSQDLMPLFFVRGAQSCVQSVLDCGSLKKHDTHER